MENKTKAHVEAFIDFESDQAIYLTCFGKISLVTSLGGRSKRRIFENKRENQRNLNCY